MGLPTAAAIFSTPLLRHTPETALPSSQLHNLHQKSLQERQLSDTNWIANSPDNLADLNSLEPYLFESREEFFGKSVIPQQVIESFDPEAERNQVWFPGNIYFGENKGISSPDFETYEIYESVNLIEFKMTEINFLIKDCINNMIENNLLIDLHVVKEACVGINFQVLFQNFEDGMQKLRSVLVELLHLKFARLGEDYRDDKEYFFSTLDRFMARDMFLPESLKVARKAAGYHGSRANFDSMSKMAQPEIEAFDYLHKKLRKDRKEIQEMLQMEAKREHEQAEKILWDEDMMEEFRRVRKHVPSVSKEEASESESKSSEHSMTESDSESSGSESSEESEGSDDSEESSESESDGHHKNGDNPDNDEEEEEKENEDEAADGEGAGEKAEVKGEGGEVGEGEGRRKKARRLHRSGRKGVLGFGKTGKYPKEDKNKL